MRWTRIVAVLMFPMFLGNAGKALAQSTDDSAERAKKVHTSMAEIGKFADEEVIWLDRIYALEQGFPPTEDMVLGQLSASSAQGGGQFELKGWVRRSDDLTRLADGIAARDGKIIVNSSRVDRSVPPYACSFDASVRPKSKSEIEYKGEQHDSASRDQKRLAEWRHRALPPDPVLARSLYQDWLRKLTVRTGFRRTTLVATVTGARREQFTRSSFSLTARARLGDLILFMYEFYSAGFLHQIRKLDVKPSRGSRDLQVALGIEALSLPTAESKDNLPNGAGSVLKFSKLSDYREPIVARDFFAYVQRLPANAPRPEKPADPADFVVVTGFTEVDGGTRVWIVDRVKSKRSVLSTGDSFAVGNVKGTVQAIRAKGEVVIEFEGHRRLLHAGDNLHGGVEIPDSQPNERKESANSTDSAPNRDN